MPSNFSELQDMMRASLVRKPKLIPTTTTLKQQGLVLHLNTTPDLFCIQKLPTTPPIHNDHKKNNLAEKEVEDDNIHFEKLQEMITPSLSDFKETCPPGGGHSIILYTTSLRGIRKTFQDCNTIRFLLRSFKVVYHERDVSLHLAYREELWKMLGGKVIPPRLFIKGRYIGGADEVVGLHEMGWLGKFLEGTPTHSSHCPCIGCSNMRFTICSNCCGSCKVFTTANNIGDSNNDQVFVRCPECNENGLVKCSICC